MAVDMSGGFSSTYRLMRVNPETWGTDGDPIELDSLSVKTSGTDSVPLLQTGKATTTMVIGESFEPGWYRAQMLAVDSGGSTQRVDIATLLFEKASGTVNYSVDTQTLSGFSVLKPVSEAKMPAGEWIARGENGASWCAKMISDHTPAPVHVECEFSVNDYYVWDAGTSYLKAVWQVLDSANCVIMIDGKGEIHIKDKPTEPSLELHLTDSELVLPGLDYDQDYSDVPNVYYAVSGDSYAVAVNDDPVSKTSTVKRGWIKDEYDDDVMLVGGETLQDYANRKLEERSTVMKTWPLRREYYEEIQPFELIRSHYPKLLHEDLRVLSQSYTCDKGITVDETLGQEIKLWRKS